MSGVSWLELKLAHLRTRNELRSKHHRAPRQSRVVLTVSDSLLRPLVMNVKPCVSMATPVFWMCSSAYLRKKQEAQEQIAAKERGEGGALSLSA